MDNVNPVTTNLTLREYAAVHILAALLVAQEGGVERAISMTDHLIEKLGESQ